MRRGNGLIALALSMLCACSDGRAGTLPSTSPPNTPSPTTSGTGTPDRDSLDQALRTYFDALYAAGLDPATKTDPLASLIDPACTCFRVVNVLKQQAAKGRYVDYGYTLSDVVIIDVRPQDGLVNYTVHQSSGALRDRSGTVVETYPASRERFSAHFSFRSGGWLLDRVEQLR